MDDGTEGVAEKDPVDIDRDKPQLSGIPSHELSPDSAPAPRRGAVRRRTPADRSAACAIAPRGTVRAQ
ncbi:hypothetical protein GCM10010277_72290 [Streptomyces longisporoflavus]|nr:hypothetical protein GCM10010277_72290 [Streptomyces longisporoflavus]